MYHIYLNLDLIQLLTYIHIKGHNLMCIKVYGNTKSDIQLISQSKA